MIRFFEPPHLLAPEPSHRFQLGPALAAGLIAGVILLIAPRGTPWSALTFFSPAIMGRTTSAAMNMPLPEVWALHLAVAVVYGLIICWLAGGLQNVRAIVAGGLLSLVLYWGNLAIVSWCWPAWRGTEVPVLFAHIVFGLICAGAYRGLLRRKMPIAAS